MSVEPIRGNYVDIKRLRPEGALARAVVHIEFPTPANPNDLAVTLVQTLNSILESRIHVTRVNDYDSSSLDVFKFYTPPGRVIDYGGLIATLEPDHPGLMSSMDVSLFPMPDFLEFSALQAYLSHVAEQVESFK